MNQNKIIWGIHADAHDLFLEKNCIAIGWAAMGNLSHLTGNWETLKEKLITVYPEAKPGAIPNYAGQLSRFVTQIKEGDYVAYPAKSERKIYFGKVLSEYRYDPKTDEEYPNQRTVKWLTSLPRTHFSQGALYEIGSAMTLFQIKTYASEFFVAIEGQTSLIVPIAKDETLTQVTKDIEETTKDFVLKRLAQELKGLPLEGFIAHLLTCMGYHTRPTRTNEPSIDLIAHKDQLGIEPPIIKVQVKSSEDTANDKDVSALYGKLSIGEYGLFITLGRFSASARNFEQSKSNLRLIDGTELLQIIFEHYEKFNAHYKGLLPLRRVYVPESLENDEM